MSEAAELLAELIRNRCVNTGAGSGGEERSVATLSAVLGEPDARWEAAPTRTSAQWRLEGIDPSAPHLTLLAHLDVVPVNPDGWTRDPFGGEITEGHVWGRGAVDMLDLASIMALVFRDVSEGVIPVPPGGLSFLAVADEETGGALGARMLVEDHWDSVRCDALLTEVAHPGWITASSSIMPVTVGEKGPFERSLHTIGKPGHASQPYLTENALERLVDLIRELGRRPTPTAIVEPIREFIDALDLPSQIRADLVNPERLPIALAAVAEKQPSLARYLHAATHLTITPTMASVGTKSNVIPDSADAVIDVRALPGQSAETIDLHLEQVAGDLGLEVSYAGRFDHPANVSQASGSLWEAVSKVAGQGGSRPVPTITTATTDARFFRAKGVTAYGVRAIDPNLEFGEFLSMFHGNDEKVPLTSLELTRALTGEIVETFAISTR